MLVNKMFLKILLIFVAFLIVTLLLSSWWLSRNVSVPFITRSSDPDLESITLPEGFSISYLTKSVEGARSMTLSANGIMYVGTRDKGNVYAIVLDENTNEAVQTFTIATGLDSPNGVAWHDGDLYVAEISRVIKFENIDESYSDSPSFSIVKDDFPSETHHGWKYLRVGPDNKLYVPIGAPCNNCDSEDERFATITRMNLDGSDFEIVASGIRNSVGFDWHPYTQELWFTDNGRDWLGDDSPGDELNRSTSLGEHFGFPYCHNDDISDPDLGAGKDCEEFVPPVQVLGPHVASLGMRFYTGDSFPESYQNTIFIAEHGSWNRSDPIGYRITTVSFDEYDEPQYEAFAEGWLDDGQVRGRPVDVIELPDESLAVSDDHAGVIYKISYD